jgi:uncharacterized membrane-anchored protein
VEQLLARRQSVVEGGLTRMQDIKNPRLLWLKGGLFLFIGIVSSVMLFLDAPTLRTLLLLSLAIWGFCRAYYFAFYVIEHYVDGRFRFSGLVSFIAYALRRRSSS